MWVVIIENRNNVGGMAPKAVGPYKSYDLAKFDAKAWGGYAIPLEDRIKWATDGNVLRASRQRR